MTRGIRAAVLAALLAVPAAAGSATTVTGAPRVTQTTLANGLRIVVVENHAVPVAQVAIWYRFGSVDDPPGHHGLAHAIEHMMSRGTHALSGPALDLVSARLGIDANAETDYEYTHYYQTLPVDGLAVALHIEADRMRGLLLEPREWNLERGAILAELAAVESSDVDALEGAVRRAAYGLTPFAHDQVGTLADLRHTGVAALRRAYDAAYAPDNATLVVTGDIVPGAVVRLASALFGPIRAHAHIHRVDTETPVARGFTVRRKAVSEDIVDVALDSRGLLAADAAAESVAVELLRPRHAALRDLLVDPGPCTSYQIDDEAQLHGGLVHLICHLDDVTAADAVRSIRRALRRLASHVPAGAIAYARRADLAEDIFARDSLPAEADLFGASLALQRTDPRRLDVDVARVSDAAVTAVLRRWATPLGVGIASGATSRFSFDDPPARTMRAERITPSSAKDSVTEPGWAHDVALPIRSRPAPSAETFALANGLRVYVERRRGNGTVYLRGGFDRPTMLGYAHTRRLKSAARAAERKAMILDVGPETNLHGFARDLAPMLALLAGLWRNPPPLAYQSRDLSRAPGPRDAWIAVTGDVDPLAVRAVVAQSFGDWRVLEMGAYPEPSPRRRSLPRTGVMTFGAPAAGARAFLMQVAPGRDDPDFDAMTLLNTILGENGDADSRLAREVRTRRGLVYGIGSIYDATHGELFISFDSASRDFTAARAAVHDVVETLRTGGVTPAERDRARRKLLAKALRESATPDGILERLSAAARDRRPPDDIETLAARYDAVTLDDLRRVARTRLLPDQVLELDEGRPKCAALHGRNPALHARNGTVRAAGGPAARPSRLYFRQPDTFRGA